MSLSSDCDALASNCCSSASCAEKCARARGLSQFPVAFPHPSSTRDDCRRHYVGKYTLYCNEGPTVHVAWRTTLSYSSPCPRAIVCRCEYNLDMP
ncbi:hypothetical protein J6590_074753 [Homalodisca vitripennis]|nr:hypothetical protein J6590_074753 [Homalodisca vitripennis]